MAHAGLSVVQVIKQLCNPAPQADSQQVVQTALALLDRRIKAAFTPDVYSLEIEESAIWLDHLEPPSLDASHTPLLVYWMNRYAHQQQEFSQILHRYRDPSLKRMGCVVIGQLVNDYTASLRSRLLEIIEDSSLTQVVVASLISCEEAESEFHADFSGLVDIKSVSLVSFERKEQLTPLRGSLYRALELPAGPMRMIFMPPHLKRRIFN